MATALIPRLIRAARPVAEASPAIKARLKKAHLAAARTHHDLARFAPTLIRPLPRLLTMSLTSYCNFRCRGCLYGRGFKEGTQLSSVMVETALADAAAAGIETVRFYGGEPLLHPGLPDFVAAARRHRLRSYVTTNGILLGNRIVELCDAGLQAVTIGFYGSADHYRTYTQRSEQRARLERSLSIVRDRVGDKIELQLNLVLLKTATSVDSVREAWHVAQRFNMFLHIDLVSYSVPFFNNDASLGLQFDSTDRELLKAVATELLQLKSAAPERVLHSPEFLRSIPDWLIKKSEMRIPCDAYEMVWIGSDGTVQLCDTAFALGSLHHTRLRDLLFAQAHRQACRDGFALNCPNCICRAESRVARSRAAQRLYR